MFARKASLTLILGLASITWLGGSPLANRLAGGIDQIDLRVEGMT